MGDVPMAVLTAVSTTFHARIIAARLGADGIVWQLRGNVDSPYPVGWVEILVPAEQLREAQQLLLVDELEEVFEDRTATAAPVEARRTWLVIGLVAFCAAFVLLRLFAV